MLARELLPVGGPLFFHEENTSSLKHYTRNVKMAGHRHDPPAWKRLDLTDVVRWHDAIIAHASAQGRPLPSAMQRRWRTCALVGASSSLLGRAQGDAIDAADAVLRLNEAPTPEYQWDARSGPRVGEVDVGRRTTMRISGAFMRARIKKTADPPEAIRVVYCQPLHYVDNCWWSIPGVVPSDKSPGDAWPRISPRLHMLALNEMWRDLSEIAGVHVPQPGQQKTLSTGAIAIFVALRLCDRLSIFGFGTRRDWDDTRVRRRCPPEGNATRLPKKLHPYHGCGKYYGHTCIAMNNYLEKDTRAHNIQAEHLWIDFLSHNGRLIEYC
mmetsp:Transcript_40440/g.86249  ORF Transcript_40440/g.86249 Transcript_40440/m.86249 type:complete len:325 (-) Transcript_40440:195-1169(-)